MAYTRTLPARVEQGGLRWRDVSLAAVALSKLEGCDVDVAVAKHHAGRSLAQNRAWWGITIPIIADHLGYDMHEHEMVHYALVAKCFGETRDERLGHDVPNVRSSKLTTAQFTQLMDWAQRFAATEWGVVIPSPNEPDWSYGEAGR
jgi:hypothetical protein